MSSTQRYLVGYDGTGHGDAVLSSGFSLARRAGPPGIELHVVQVIEPMSDGAIVPVRTEEASKRLEELRSRVQRAVDIETKAHGELGVGSVVAHIALGEPAAAIARLAADLDADAVVVGTHGRRGVRRMLLGSVAEGVVRLAGCPVIVTRDKSHLKADVPDVEPVCADCAVVRTETAGRELWCERHAERHPRAHVYSYTVASLEPTRPWGFHQ
ncbi:MAG: universal stress protein [Polyangiales bacterium]